MACAIIIHSTRGLWIVCDGFYSEVEPNKFDPFGRLLTCKASSLCSSLHSRIFCSIENNIDQFFHHLYFLSQVTSLALYITPITYIQNGVMDCLNSTRFGLEDAQIKAKSGKVFSVLQGSETG